jgi:hypothetical protein
MAKKELVESIVKLYSKLGGNMNDVLGSRSNITFLGTGKNPEPFVDMSLNMEAVGALGKSKVLDELKSPMGYLTADKLNDIQAGKLYENMLKLDNFYNPKDYTIPNITDMATGTRNLDAEGIMTLRRGGDPNLYKPGDAITSENFAASGFAPAADTGLMSRIENQMKNIKATSSKLDDAIKEYEKIYKPADAGTTIKNLEKQEAGLGAQFKNIVTNKSNAPAKRASAREFLVEALKADDTFATRLGTIIDAQDVKFITEGGGGIAGDPLVLVEKYFGPRISEMIPVGATGEEIITFTRRVMNNVEDAAGLKPDNPRFDRLTARFVDEMAQGGLAKILEV